MTKEELEALVAETISEWFEAQVLETVDDGLILKIRACSEVNLFLSKEQLNSSINYIHTSIGYAVKQVAAPYQAEVKEQMFKTAKAFLEHMNQAKVNDR